VAAGIAAMLWVPQSSGYIVAIGLALLVFTPNVLGNLARRRVEAGYRHAAAFYARLACVFHPSRAMRFQSSFLAAQILGSIEERVDAYKALALHAAPEQSELLNCSILVARDDWEGVLERFRGAGDKLPALIQYKIRALANPYRRAASYVDRILRGAKPGDLPVQFPTKFEMVVDRRAATELGLAVPPSILLRADEVIE
jgi:hypothetical protein